MNFEFMTASRIVFGAGTVREAAKIAADFGGTVLVLTGDKIARAAPLLDALGVLGVDYVTHPVLREPTVQDASEAAALARARHVRGVIAIGGGSVLDAGKAVAALAVNDGDPLDYLEVIGKGKALTQKPLPCVAVPTTAGTGSEVTRNAVLSSPAHHVKVSLRHPMMLPVAAVIDPQLTYSLPPAVTAATGMDALTQVIEPFVSNAANPITDALCREGITRAARSLRRAYENGHDVNAREDMALASLFGGLALANAKLGAVHGFAAPIGGMFPAPHGAVCARLLPHVMRANIHAMRTREPSHPALERYAEVARRATGKADASPEDGAEWVAVLCDALAIPPLRTYGMSAAHLDDVAQKSAVASSMKGNPIVLTHEELVAILSAAH